MSESAQAVQAPKERRVALIIGNAKYAVGPQLINTERDAIGVAEALYMLGFVSHIRGPDGADIDLIPLYDQTLIGMMRALADFTVAASDADMAVIYYSGHGIEIDFKNFLIPIDATLSHKDRLAFEAVPLGDVITSASKARKLRLVILDACRDNPLAERMKGLDPGKSTAPIGIGPPGTGISALTFYAATEGQRARQGPPLGRSPFAEALIARLLQPLELGRVFGRVTDDVRKTTDGQQEPRLYGPPQPDDIFFLGSPDRETTHGDALPVPRPLPRSERDPKVRRRAFLFRISIAVSFSFTGAITLAGSYVYFTTDTGFITYRGQDEFFRDAVARAALPANAVTYNALRLPQDMYGRRLKLLSFSSFEGTLNDRDWWGVVQPDELAPPPIRLPRLLGPIENSTDAVSGRKSMNFAPQTIPPVPSSAVLTSTKNSVVFDVSAVSKIWVRFDFKTNTNPRPAAQHNCDSSLRMQGRFDGGEWKIHSVLCGKYPGEGDSWERNMFSFPVKPGAKTFEFAMDLSIQNNPPDMTGRYYLIDNAMIIGER
jgi:hypothetical protein